MFKSTEETLTKQDTTKSGDTEIQLSEPTIHDSFYPYHMTLCLLFLGCKTKVLTLNCFSNEEGINCTASNLCHVSKGAMLSAHTEIKWKHKCMPSHIAAKGWNEAITALVYGLMLPFAVNSNKHYIKFVAMADSCYNIHSQFFLSRKPIPQFMKLERHELCITSEKLRGTTFTGMDQWADSYFVHSQKGTFFHFKILHYIFGECVGLCIS